METIPEISESGFTSAPRDVVEEEMETISALKEEDADKLWKEVREHKAHKTMSYDSAPFLVIQCSTYVAANATLYGDALNTIEEDVLRAKSIRWLHCHHTLARQKKERKS